MTDPYFNEIDRPLERLIDQEQWNEGAQFLAQNLDRYPAHRLQMQVYQALLCARGGDTSTAYHIAEQAIHAGQSFPLNFRSLAPLKDLPGYAELVERNERILAAERQAGRMEYAVRLPEGHDTARRWPLFLVLHGDGVDGNLPYIEWQWQPDALLREGFVVAYIQSSQVLFTGAFGWMPDAETTRQDVRAAFDHICAEYAIDPQGIYLGGFSGGAIATLDLAFSQTLPVTGFVALCPELRPDGFTRPAVEAACARRMKGVILEGDQTFPTPDQREMLSVLDAVAFPYRLVINARTGHAIPEDFQEKLADAIRFLV